MNEKDFDDSKKLWWLKNIAIKKIHASNKMTFSSNVNDVIKAVLNSFFFYEKISHAPKSTKAQSTKTEPSKSTKHYKRTKIKNALKKHLRGEKVTYSLIWVFVLCVGAKKRE